MLGKLFKYEFKSTAKVMLTIYVILIATTILGTISLSTDAMQTDLDTQPLVIQLLFFGSIMLYVLSVFALFVVTYIYVCIHFYKTMYSEQGYLTHTLPVKPSTLFNVKLITAWVWMIGSMGLFLLSLFALMTGATRGELLEVLNFSLMQEVFGMTWGQYFLLMILMIVLSCLSYLLMVFVSISIGQLFNQHKIVWAIVAGIVIYFVEQTVGSIVLLATGGSVFENMVYTETVTIYDIMFSTPMVANMVISVLFTVAFYIACVVIQKRHLNLD